MNGMPMPGGWTMSTMWMRMPDQTWAGAASTFLAMWIAMMAAMMLPSLSPVLWRRYHAVAAVAPASAARQTALVGVGYFAAWAAVGATAFPLGVALAALAMRQPVIARGVPIAAAIVVLAAGAIQFSAAKARHLACCQDVAIGNGEPHDSIGSALRAGLRHGLRCVRACAGPTAILFALGVMNPVVMTLVTAAITLERLVPASARLIGVACLGGGFVLLARVTGLG